jgi:hypothetical protein
MTLQVIGGIKMFLAIKSKEKNHWRKLNLASTKTLWYANFGFGFITIVLLLLHFFAFFDAITISFYFSSLLCRRTL